MYLPDVQAGFRKGRGTRDQIANIRWIMEKAREFQKNIYFCFIDYAKAFGCVDHNKLRKILKEMGIPDHLTCLLRNLYAGREATVRTGHGTTDWFQIGKGVRQGSPAVALPFPLTELSLLKPLAVCNPPAPKPSSRSLGPKCKGKAGVELKPGRRQWRFPASHSLLLPGEGA